MRYINVSHGIQSHPVQVTDNVTTAHDILNNATLRATLGIGGNVSLVDQDGNTIATITPDVTSAQVVNQGSGKGAES